ncbi:MAG: hypothetical protein AAF928_17895 [Myxococcota bacterium]
MARRDKARPAGAGLAVVGVVVMGPAAGAHAQVPSTSIHATGTLTAGYDTNINAVGEGDEATGGPVAAFTVQPSPGVAFFVDTPRVRFGLTAATTFFFFIGNPEFDTTGQDVNAALAYALSPTEELNVAAGWNRFTTNIVTLQDPNETAGQAQPQGAGTLNTFTATQGYARDFSPFLRLLQTSTASFSFDEASDETGQPPFLTVGVGGGPEAILGNHALAALGDVQWVVPIGAEEGADDIGFATQEQVLLTATGRWRWDFDLEWTSELSAGLTTTVTPGFGPGFAPIGSAGVFWTRENYAAGLTYERSVTPDIVTGQVFTIDAFTLQGSVPIWAPWDLSLQTSTGFAFSEIVGQGDEANQAIDTGLVNTWVVDAAVGWTPPRYPNVEVRYQHFQQFGASDDQQVLPNFDRDVVSLVVSYTYPQQNIALPTGQPRRVDGGDRDRTLFGADETARSEQRRERAAEAPP